jgi:hypothetical protein
MADSGKTTSRGQILAAKLRENLKRRKAQARARSAPDKPAAEGVSKRHRDGGKGT